MQSTDKTTLMIVMIGKNTYESMRNMRIIELLFILPLSLSLSIYLSHALLFPFSLAQYLVSFHPTMISNQKNDKKASDSFSVELTG